MLPACIHPHHVVLSFRPVRRILGQYCCCCRCSSIIISIISFILNVQRPVPLLPSTCGIDHELQTVCAPLPWKIQASVVKTSLASTLARKPGHLLLDPQRQLAQMTEVHQAAGNVKLMQRGVSILQRPSRPRRSVKERLLEVHRGR